MIEKGGGRNAKANESTFCIFARTAFPRLRVLRWKKKKKKLKRKERNRKAINWRSSDFFSQVPSVSVDMETPSELTCGKNGKKKLAS